MAQLDRLFVLWSDPDDGTRHVVGHLLRNGHDYAFGYERDLAAARLTQQSLIPQKPLALPGWEVATCYRPVIQVGGDIYGWLRMKDGRTLFWIVDATASSDSTSMRSCSSTS